MESIISDQMFSAIIMVVNNHMETEGGLYFQKLPLRFHIQISELPFLGANVPPEIIFLNKLVETEIFAKINFMKQGK